MEEILQLEQDVFIYLNNLGTSQWDNFWVWVSDKKSWIPFYALLLIALSFYLKKWKSILLLVCSIALLITIVDQTTSSFFKPVVGRFRPCHMESLDHLVRIVNGYCGGKYGFFSSHASNSFALAIFVGFIFRKLKFVFLIMLLWAMLHSYSRIYLGVHLPFDILVGALWGSAWGYLFYRLFNYINIRWTKPITQPSEISNN